MEFMVTELLKRGADPNKEKGYSGSTPLHLAIAKEKVGLVQHLLKKGADLEAKDDYGYTPFLQAVKYGAPGDIVDLLLEAGANVVVLAEDRKSALHFLAQKKGEEMMTRKLVARGLSVDAEDNDGWTPLHEAAQNGSKDVAEVFIEKGQSLVLRGGSYNQLATQLLIHPCLMHARTCGAKNQSIKLCAVCAGASVNARDHRKRTPLHLAAEEGEEELITFLLDNKADPNVTDLEGNTPLDLAAKKLFESTVNLLLEHSHSSRKDDAVKKTIEKVMDSDRVKDDLVERKIGELSPLR